MKLQVLIRKIPNSVGNYNTQRYENNRWVVECFKSFDDAVTTMFFKGFTKVFKELNNSLILEKGEF